MRRFRVLLPMALAATLGVANGGCLLIPEIRDRIVELAVGGSTVVEFVSSGTINNHDETNTLDILDDLDLAQILADAGVDVSDVQSIALSGVDYRITVADPDPGREIVNGTVTIDRDGSGPLALISNFNAGAGAVTGWMPAPLDPGGLAVADINAMLNAIVATLPGAPPPNVTTITYHVTGQSLPQNVATNFTWEMKVRITIVGIVRVKVPT